MSALAEYGKEIVALLVPLVAWGLNRFFSPKAKLQFSNPHAFIFSVQEPLRDADGKILKPNQNVHTRSLIVRNAGTQTATKVEWVFMSKPFCLNVWPLRDYEQREIASGGYAIIFPSLGPGEHVGCEVMAINSNVPDVVTVRCDQCVAEWVQMTPQPVAEPWKIKALLALALAGLALLSYLAIVLLQILILATPVGR